MKVSLGCALVHDPGHLLLDEPTNGLDVPTVRSLRNLLKRLRDRGACIIFSSHVLSEVEELCDRVIVMARGAVRAEGTLDEVRDRTRSQTLEDAFVALTGEAEPSEAHASAFRCASARHRLAAAVSDCPASGRARRLARRRQLDSNASGLDLQDVRAGEAMPC
jgi:ABC-type multidrug transport system ATPase subunit